MNTHTAPPAATLIVYALHALRSMLLCCIPWLSLGGTSSAVVAQTPNWGPAQWNFPQAFPATSPVFEPVEVFPRSPVGGTLDPGQPPASCPLLRGSGIRGFRYDAGTPNDPNDDREYLVCGRSDGILIADATPPRDPNPSANPGIPASPLRKVMFVTEPNPETLPLSWPSPVPTLGDILNGCYNPSTNQFDGVPYCPPGTNHVWTSSDTTNREVAVHRDGATWYVYSVNTFRAGLWVIRLTPGPAGELIVDPNFGAGQGVWKRPTYSTPAGPRALGDCHNIDVDGVAGREALYLTDHGGHVVQLDLGTPEFPGSLYARSILSPDVYHDAMVVGEHLVVSRTGPAGPLAPGPGTFFFLLQPLASGPPVQTLSIPFRQAVGGVSFDLPMGHSVYIDAQTPFQPYRLYTLEEDARPFSSKRNITVFGLDLSDSGPSAWVEAIVPYVYPTGVVSSPITVSPVHNLRGLGRTGFVAQFREGLGLIDLLRDESSALSSSDPGFFDNETLASFDTTSRVDGTSVPPFGYPTTGPANAPYATMQHWRGDPNAQPAIPTGLQPYYATNGGHGFWDKFLGAWDAVVTQDSGLVYCILGPNVIPGSSPSQDRPLTVGVFRVHQGHLNRYWDATPFPSGPNAGRVPRLIGLNGPPRQGQSFLVGDESVGSYAASDGQYPLKYEYTLIFSPSAPGGIGGSNPATASPPILWDPDAVNPSNNLVALNVWDHTAAISAQWKLRQGPESPTNPVAAWFSFANVGNQGQRWYAQLIVQEFAVVSGVNQSTGRFAASRGVWFGVAKP